MKAFIKLYGCESYSQSDARNIVSVRYNMTKTSFGISNPYTFAEDISKDTVAIIQENSNQLPGATTTVTTSRTYPSGTLAPQILGTVGALNQEEYNSLKDSGYALNDTIGQNGLESAFESNLRGKNGSTVVTTGKDGTVISSNITTPAVSGNTIYTTLNSNVQNVANVSLANNIKAAQKAGYKHCTSGGVVVVNVKDFGILAASTFPSYDLGLYKSDSSYYNTLVNDPNTPLLNRAFDGTYAPGSTFKPIVAAAALQEGTITSSSSVYCTGIYTYFAPSYEPKCWLTSGHGETSVVKALAESCDVFFYDAGRRMGIDPMNTYANRAGLGVKTGVEVGESVGVMSNPTERANAGGLWTPGTVVQAAIGQADDSFSPLQLATYTATIANNGVRYKTHLLDKITNYNHDKTISNYQPVVADNLGVSQDNLNLVKEGMREDTEPGGTAYGMFGSYGVKVAAKTGTAEVSGSDDNTVFIAYAPYDKPRNRRCSCTTSWCKRHILNGRGKRYF